MVIDVDDYKQKCSSKKVKPKVWIANLKLTEQDKKTLLDPVGWLNDSIINAAQRLLKKQFPAVGSLQDVALGLVMNFSIQPSNCDFVQILHSNSHWVTVSSTTKQHPSSIQVYDSLYKSISTIVKEQIASLLSTPNNEIRVNVMDVQTQVLAISGYFHMSYYASS